MLEAAGENHLKQLPIYMRINTTFQQGLNTCGLIFWKKRTDFKGDNTYKDKGNTCSPEDGGGQMVLSPLSKNMAADGAGTPLGLAAMNRTCSTSSLPGIKIPV